MGYQAVEFDVMLSGDGTPVLIHDETLERTTNGHGRVCATGDRSLFALDAGQGERIPTFVEAARLCRELGLLANVEIKPAAGHERETAETVARVAAAIWHDAPSRVLISSFVTEALAIALAFAPTLPRGLLFERVPPAWTGLFRSLRATTLHCDADHIDDRVLREAVALGVPVVCYTVNENALAQRLIERGVSAMFTDRLELFAETAV